MGGGGRRAAAGSSSTVVDAKGTTVAAVVVLRDLRGQRRALQRGAQQLQPPLPHWVGGAGIVLHRACKENRMTDRIDGWQASLDC